MIEIRTEKEFNELIAKHKEDIITQDSHYNKILISGYSFGDFSMNIEDDDSLNIVYLFKFCSFNYNYIKINSKRASVIFDHCNLNKLVFNESRLQSLLFSNCSGELISIKEKIEVKKFQFACTNINVLLIGNNSKINKLGFTDSIIKYFTLKDTNVKEFNMSECKLCYSYISFKEKKLSKFGITNTSVFETDITLSKEKTDKLIAKNKLEGEVCSYLYLNGTTFISATNNTAPCKDVLRCTSLVIPTISSNSRLISYYPNHGIYQIGCRLVTEDDVKDVIINDNIYSDEENQKVYLKFIDFLKENHNTLLGANWYDYC